MSHDLHIWAIYQMIENLILNKKVLVNVCDWTNSFERFWKKTLFWRPSWIWACHVTGTLCVIYQTFWFLILNIKVLLNLHDWSNGFGVILKKVLFGGHLGKWRIARLCHPWRMSTIEILFLQIFTLPTIYDTPSNHYNCHGNPYAPGLFAKWKIFEFHC